MLSNDQTATVANLQKFADAYNAVMKSLQSQLNVSSGTDRNKVMAGDSSAAQPAERPAVADVQGGRRPATTSARWRTSA